MSYIVAFQDYYLLRSTPLAAWTLSPAIAQRFDSDVHASTVAANLGIRAAVVLEVPCCPHCGK